MTTEIRHTPIPTAEHRHIGDHEEVELVCRECDLHVHIEGDKLPGVAALVDEGHEKRHEALEATP